MSQMKVAVRDATRVEEGGALPFPTPAMERFAEACYRGGLEKSDDELCEEVKIKPKTLKLWQRRREFREWLRAEIEQRMADDSWKVWMRVRNDAESAEGPSRKAYLERFGQAAPRKSENAPESVLDLAELAHLAAESCKETIP